VEPLRQVVTQLSAAGIILRARGDRLVVESRVPLTEQQRAWIRAHKTDLLRMASDPLGPPGELSEDDRAAVQEAIDERAAIRELDGGEPRAIAEREARSAMRVYQYRITDKPTSWLTLIAPGCDLEEARRIVTNQFGAARVLEVVPYRASGIGARSPDEPPDASHRGKNT